MKLQKICIYDPLSPQFQNGPCVTDKSNNNLYINYIIEV